MSSSTVVSERELPRLLAEGLGERVDFYTEYFDFGRFPHPEYESAYLDFLRLKYAERRLDLLLVMGDAATDFVSRNRDVLFSGTPAVFYTLIPTAQPHRQFHGICSTSSTSALQSSSRWRCSPISNMSTW